MKRITKADSCEVKMFFTRVVPAMLLLVHSPSVNAQTTFNYTGSVQTYTVPVGVTTVAVDVRGAQGGTSYYTSALVAGANGGRVQGILTVTPGEVLQIYVAGAGGNASSSVGGTAGYNGGAAGGANSDGQGGGGGGGASDIRRTPYSLNDRLVVGGGGGGAASCSGTGYGGGSGGGLIGGTPPISCGSPNNSSTGGTQSAGGIGGSYTGWCNAGSGIFGSGAAGCSPAGSGGGGGGWYGGGGGAWMGGGGGSSYTASGVSSVTHTQAYQPGNGQVIITILFSVAITQNTPIACFGQSTASLTATPVGSTGPYTYSWAPSGGTSATATGLGAGTYTVTVTDGLSNVATQTFTVTQPSALSQVIGFNNVTCNGACDGVVMSTPIGGTSPYSYLWSPGGGTTAMVTNLCDGTYTCTVTDANGCVTSGTTSITQPAVLSQVIGFGNVTCNGACDGMAMSTPTGGISPYTYSWSPSGGSSTIASGLCAGTYSCLVTDANGCTTTGTTSITEPAVLSLNLSQTNVACFGGNNGDATITPSGGTVPYAYSWSTGGSNATESGLAAGTYTCTVTDANGCTATQVVTITEPAVLNVTSTQSNVSCFGGADGMIDLTVTGGTMPYTFDWNSGTYTTEDLTGIPAGTYSGTLTDANGCTSSGTITITEPTAITATFSVTDATTCGGTDGAIDMTTGGGVPGYVYLWSNTSTTEDLTGITAGSYTCTITDANGCMMNTSAVVNDPAPPSVSVTLNVSTICADDASVTLSGGAPAGGVYSGTSVSAGVFDPSTTIIGANTITYTYTDPTTGCTAAATDVINVSACTGINETNGNVAFSVNPNPNNGIFTLELNTSSSADVMIYNALGQLVSRMKFQPSVVYQVNLATTGVYTIEIITADGQRSTQRVVVSK